MQPPVFMPGNCWRKAGLYMLMRAVSEMLFPPDNYDFLRQTEQHSTRTWETLLVKNPYKLASVHQLLWTRRAQYSRHVFFWSGAAKLISPLLHDQLQLQNLDLPGMEATCHAELLLAENSCSAGWSFGNMEKFMEECENQCCTGLVREQNNGDWPWSQSRSVSS